MIANSLFELDRRHLVHPVSNWRSHESKGPIILESARGLFVRDTDGNELLDAFAGLWCVNVGFGQDSIVRAAAEQMTKLPYATGYFGFASEPAIRLAAELVELAPPGLNRVYFGLSGSDAVDSAIRYITHYFNATGRPAKKNFIALERGYHGSSSNGAGLTALPAFHRLFDLPHAWQHHIPSPHPYRHAAGGDHAALIAASVKSLEDKVADLGGPEQVAAFFCEPVQGSGGIIVPPRGWLAAMRETCRSLGILFVADEVITGFGRTGPMFACESEKVVPDLMTIAKGLTAGYVPMGAVLMSEEIYAGIADAAGSAAIGHGTTYSAHPVSAAVALEVLRLYGEGGIIANAQRVAPVLRSELATLSDHPLVGDIRVAGMLAGIELVADKTQKTPFDPDLGMADRMFATGYGNRIIFRAFNDAIIGLAPALTCSEEEAHLMVSRIRTTLDMLLEMEDVRAAMRG